MAKNLLKHPFVFTLYDDPVLDIPYDRWDRFHIWLHKQPLFLWQIAICFRLFGVSEFTMRIPDIAGGILMTALCYQCGKLALSRAAGFYSAVIFLSTPFMLELAGGKQALEHNDFSFMLYITLSIWSWMKYITTKKKTWLMMTGLFSGMAVLCKWLVGLLVYLAWFSYIMLQRKDQIRKNSIPFFMSLLVTLAVALPWQFYIFTSYPVQAAAAYQYNFLHLTIPLDGHSGPWWFHLAMAAGIYGWPVAIIVVPGWVVFYRKCRDKKLCFALLSMVVGVYVFFSAAVTKMDAFTTVVAMPVLVAAGALLASADELLHGRMLKIVFAALFLLFILYRFDVEGFQRRHTVWDKKNLYTRELTHNRQVLRSLRLPSNAVLFNVPGRHYIEAMFYTDLPSYNGIPNEQQFQSLKEKGRRIAVFNNGTDMPDFLMQDTTVILIGEKLEMNE